MMYIRFMKASQVERVLSMVDGVVLVVDMIEGPRIQTRFVLGKALQIAHLRPIVVVNKVRVAHLRPIVVVNNVTIAFFTIMVCLLQTCC